MAHIKSIGVGMFSNLAYSTTVHSTDTDTLAEYAALTYDANIGNVRECPPVGAPANIVNVPQYGQAISASVQGQADAPTLEFTLNWVPEGGATGVTDHVNLQALVNDGKDYEFRIRITNAELPATVTATTEHDDFYFTAKVAAFVVTPALDDANTATMTLALNSEFYGPYTTS